MADTFTPYTEPYPITDSLTGPNQLSWYADLLPIPYRSTDPYVILDEAERLNVQRVREFHCRMFNLAIPEDLELYQLVKNRCVTGWYRIVKEKDDWDKESGHIKVWLEWLQQYYIGG